MGSFPALASVDLPSVFLQNTARRGCDRAPLIENTERDIEVKKKRKSVCFSGRPGRGAEQVFLKPEGGLRFHRQEFKRET